MQATSGFQSSRQFSSNTVKKPTRLGSAKDCAKQGRYGRVMGDHWRSDAREKLTFAANGLLMDIWSYCADQATDRVSTTAMRKLCAADQKHAGRMLTQLVSAGYLEATTEGWTVTKWVQLNPVAKHYQLRVVEAPAQQISGEAEVRAEVLAQVTAPPEIIEEPCVPRARTETQDPRVKEREPPTGVSAALPPTPPRAPRKTRPKDPGKETFKRALGEACREAGVLLEGALSLSQLAAAAKKAQEYAAREGITVEAAAHKLSREAAEQVKDGRKSALCWALRDWQPGVAPPAARAPRYTGPKPCTPAEDFPDVDIEEQIRQMHEQGRLMQIRRRAAS